MQVKGMFGVVCALGWGLRHLRTPKRSTFRLENTFWHHIDLLAKNSGRSWQDWALSQLANKPENTSAASWLRCCCLIQSAGGKNNG